MVANSSRKAHLEMRLIIIGRSDFYCIIKKINVGEKPDKEEYSRLALGKRRSWQRTARGIPHWAVLWGGPGCGKSTVLGERQRSLPAYSPLQGNISGLFLVFLNSLRNTVRSFGDRDGDESVTAVSGELAVPALQELGFSVGSLPSFVSGGGTAGSKPDNKLT